MLAGVPKTGGGLWAEGERERARAGLPAGRRWGREEGERQHGGESDRGRRNTAGHTGRRAGRWRQTQGRRETQTHPDGGHPGVGGRGVSREGNVGVRSGGGWQAGTLGSQDPAWATVPGAPSPANGSPEQGPEMGGRGCWAAGQQGAPQDALTTQAGCRARLLLETQPLSAPPCLLPDRLPQRASSTADSPTRPQASARAPLQPRSLLPKHRRKGWEMGGAVEVKITDPFIKGKKKKAKIQKKKKS